MKTNLCCFCKKVAIYSGKTTIGENANMCIDHFNRYGIKQEGAYTCLIADEVSTKVCRICGKVKAATEFYEYTDSQGILRHRNECKVCNLEERKRVVAYKLRKGHR